MNHPSPLAYRCIAVAIIGAVLFWVYFDPFLPYSQRQQFSASWWPLPVTMLICGFVLSIGLTRRRFWVPTCLVLTLIAGDAILIGSDTVTGAVDHNLFPIEFLLLAVLASPAFVGTLLGSVFDWLRARGWTT